MAARYAQLGLLSLASLSVAAPVAQDYSGVNWNQALAGVDWSKVNYGGGSSQPSGTTNTQSQPQQQPSSYSSSSPASSPSPSPSPSSSPSESSPSPSPSPYSGGGGSSTGGSSSSGGKKGLAYNDADLCQGFQGASWAWDWSDSPNGNLGGGLEFVPCLKDQSATGSWSSNAQGAKNCFSFNEPDNAGQANMSPESAASLYKSTFQTGAPSGASLGAPAVTSSQTPGQGLDWLQSFMGSCSDCKIDFINLHCYIQPGQNDWFKNWIQQAHQQFPDKPIWVSEFGINPGSGSDQDQADFISDAAKFMDGLDYVAKYSPFMVAQGSGMMTANNVIGQAYMSA